MIAAILDCVVYLQAANNRQGAGGACLTLAEQSHIRVFMSPAILDEMTDVLNRPKIRSAFPNLTDEVVAKFLANVQKVTTQEQDALAVQELPRDPKDEPYLNLAIAKRPSFLVTWDKDLLPLTHHADFKTTFPDLTISTPPAFLAHVRAALTSEADANESDDGSNLA